MHAICMNEENNPFLNYEPMSLAAFGPIFDDLVARGQTRVLVRDHDVLGTFAIYMQARRASHVAALGSFAMHPAFRGRGWGGRAMELITDLARSQGARRLELLVEADNPRAIRFYERCGFVREGVLRGAWRRAADDHDVDEIAMARML